MSQYPNSVDKFNKKLNKSDTPYVITNEVVRIVDGKGEAFLEHDNAHDTSIEVWTLPDRTGTKITNFTLEKQLKAAWRTLITVYSNVEIVYLTYETFGDQVEADDINSLQDAMTATQIELDRHKHDNTIHLGEGGVVDGGSFQ